VALGIAHQRFGHGPVQPRQVDVDMRGQRVKPVDRIAPEGNAGPHLGFGNAQARPGGQQRQRAMEAGGIARCKAPSSERARPDARPCAASPPRTATRAV